MAKDYAEIEQEFIAGLKGQTGKDLAEWMALISGKAFANKNDTIDWLRLQGFAFNWASWLERIHANGGVPLYADKPAAAVVKKAPAPRETKPEKTEKAASVAPTPVTAVSRPVARAPAAEAHNSDVALQTLIAAAKGYQPLYRLLASEIVRAVPGATLTAAESYICVGNPKEFAGIETGAKGLRLALDLGDRPFAPPLQPSKLATAPKRLSHMIVLDDARKVDAALMDLVRAAAARVNT
ncbi:MAG: hypothetical protein HC869_25010 [Rhodospirillales bacterium]|nr:hypothetical protein [Rhodospirillales bacterium]